MLQNSLPAYSVLQQIKRQMPFTRTLDLVHSVDADWNLAAATRGVDSALDTRVAISARVRDQLIEQGTERDKIRVIPNGVDLERFRDDQRRRERPVHTVFRLRGGWIR